jgi:hypothetical protein
MARGRAPSSSAAPPSKTVSNAAKVEPAATVAVIGCGAAGLSTVWRGVRRGRTADGRRGTAALRIVASQTERLESEIDAMNATMAPLDSFILPGGSPAAAYLHLARTVVRRAERLVSELAGTERVNPEALKYLNRLSDHLFVLGRRVNDGGTLDVLWTPGANR